MKIRLVAWFVFVGVLIAAAWASRLSSGAPRNAAYDSNVAFGSVLQFVTEIGVVLLIARGATDLLALRRPRSWRRAAGLGLLILVVVDLVGAAVNPYLHPAREQGLAPTRWEPAHAGVFAVFAFAVVVLAPLMEELTFRGLGFSLLRPFGLLPPIVGTAVLWSLAHGLVNALPVLVPLGIGLAWLRHRQDSTIPGMILHGTFNALALALSLTT